MNEITFNHVIGSLCVITGLIAMMFGTSIKPELTHFQSWTAGILLIIQGNTLFNAGAIEILKKKIERL